MNHDYNTICRRRRDLRSVEEPQVESKSASEDIVSEADSQKKESFRSLL